MARSLLLTILIVAAVAWSATVAGEPLAPLEEPIPAEAALDASYTTLDTQAATACRFYDLEAPNSSEPLDVRVDPDGCWREFIERNLPWISWPSSDTAWAGDREATSNEAEAPPADSSISTSESSDPETA